MVPVTDLRLDARVGDGTELGFRTADGVASPDAFRPAELALLEALAVEPPDSLLAVRANYGVVGVAAATFCDRVRMTERSARAARLCRANAAANGVEAPVTLAPSPLAVPGTYAAAACAPRPYEPNAVVVQRTADALARVRPGGALYLAATTRGGLSQFEDALADLGAVEAVSERDDVTVLRCVRPAGYRRPSGSPETAFAATVGGQRLRIAAAPGLFAADGLDDGTALLAEEATPRVARGDRVLDLCCGYGPLGTAAGRAADGQCRVTMTDDDAVAVACARRTACLNGVAPERIAAADCLRGTAGPFDLVVTNPPTHAGSGVLRELFDGVRDVLAADGACLAVHHRAVDLPLDGFGVETVREGAEHLIRRLR